MLKMNKIILTLSKRFKWMKYETSEWMEYEIETSTDEDR